MTGRKENEGKEMARTAKLMMVQLVGQYGSRVKSNGMWNCSL